jgi:hypothetical protein
MTIGVEVTTSTRTGPSNTGALSGRFHAAGLTERGPINEARLVKSIAQLEAVYGGRTPYASNVYDTARTFFEEGGAELIVSRVVGPAANAGLIILKDAEGADTLKVEATAPGAFSSGFAVQVATTGSLYTVTLRAGDEVIGVYKNLASPAALVDALRNNVSVRATDLLSDTAAPGNLPVTVAASPLSAGSDDRASITADSVTAALEAAGELGAGGAVAAPGFPADVIGTALLAYAKKAGKIALLAAEEDTSEAQAIEMAATLSIAGGEYGGLFYPHLIIPDGSGTRTISPEGYVAAVRARAHADIGFWQVPAGDRARTRWILGTVQTVDAAGNNRLAEGLVNGIVTTGGRVRLYNWASLALDQENLGLLSTRDVLNSLTIRISEALEPFVFATIDGRGHLLSKVESAVVGVLDPVAQAGGFFALLKDDEEVDPGYRVIVDESINTTSSLAKNQVLVSAAVRLSPMAALIQAEIVKVAVTAAV